MKKVRLKHPSDFDFNKMTGYLHNKYDILKDRFGTRRIFLADSFDCYGDKLYHLTDLKGNEIKEYNGARNRMSIEQLFFKPA